jgi:hypothetical protein
MELPPSERGRVKSYDQCEQSDDRDDRNGNDDIVPGFELHCRPADPNNLIPLPCAFSNRGAIRQYHDTTSIPKGVRSVPGSAWSQAAFITMFAAARTC